MKGKVDEGGFLHIERAGKYVLQYCPFSSGGEVAVKCGHWCPLFGEPEFIDGHPRLSLCRKVLEFVSLVDERGQE